MKDIEEFKLNLVKVLKKFKLDFLILFGSYAKGTYRENCENSSDIDLAFFKLSKDIDFKKLYLEISKLIKDDIGLNLINLKEDNPYFLEEEIFRYGKLIICNDYEIYYERKSQTYFNYVDYKKYDYILENSLNFCNKLVDKYSHTKNKVK